MSGEVELILDAKAILGECPSWDERTQNLYWVDIEKKQLNIFNPSSKKNRIINLNHYVSAVAPRQSGGLVLAMHHGFHFLDLENENLTPICDPEKHLPKNRFNDGKCDPTGRFWAGTTAMNDSNNKGRLYCLDTKQKITSVINEVKMSNGLAWSPDNQTMYYIDTPTKEVAAFDFHLDTGNINNKRIVVTIPDEEGVPDGMTIDEEGNIWVAHWGGYKVSCWNPNSGALLRTIKLPAVNVTSCVFGGENLNELYITTASSGLDDKALSEQPLAGGLFRLKTNVKGLPTVRYKG